MFFNNRKMSLSISRAISPEEAEALAKVNRRIEVFSNLDTNEFVFVDNYARPWCLDDRCAGWVGGSTSFPMKVAPRSGLENGIIDTIEKYIFVFEKNSKNIYDQCPKIGRITVKQFLDFLAAYDVEFDSEDNQKPTLAVKFLDTFGIELNCDRDKDLLELQNNQRAFWHIITNYVLVEE